MDSNNARASDLCSRLAFLKYDAVVADEDAGLEAALVDEQSIAVVLGSTREKSIRDAFTKVAAHSPAMPVLLCDDDVTPNSAEIDLGGRPAWRLKSPLRRKELAKLLRRAERFHGADCNGAERRQRISGQSRPIRRVRALIEQVADFDTNVLVTGESGTGKELVAKTIHDLSARHDAPFVPINCGAIPAELLESELFGHEKGAFTGAISARTGRFELANKGTLFLDEIGDMSLSMQVKLLRVLQERSFERVGSNDTRECDVRIIAATHRDLPAMVAEGTFREDLYYRLSVFPIEMPPLYKRASDLPQLFDELLIQQGLQPDSGGADVQKLRLSPEALSVLASYSWPGNVRELSNLVERLAILCPEGEIGIDDLPAKYRDGSHRIETHTQIDADADIDMTSDGPPTSQVAHCAEESMIAAATGVVNGVSLKQHLQDVEKDLITQAMCHADGVVAAAARLLHMQRTTLVEKLGKYNLKLR